MTGLQVDRRTERRDGEDCFLFSSLKVLAFVFCFTALFFLACEFVVDAFPSVTFLI
jgi:hypothetical protein